MQFELAQAGQTGFQKVAQVLPMGFAPSEYLPDGSLRYLGGVRGRDFCNVFSLTHCPDGALVYLRDTELLGGTVGPKGTSILQGKTLCTPCSLDQDIMLHLSLPPEVFVCILR